MHQPVTWIRWACPLRLSCPMSRLSAKLLVAAMCAVCPAVVFAQNPQPPPDPAPPVMPPAPTVELDQTVVNVQTTMPLRRHKSYFKITHRFSRDLRRGSFGQLAEEAFSLDSGAIIGLEYRFAITSNLQAGIHRSILGKTIHTFAKWDVLRQLDGNPFGMSVG